jgi:hypothetical protein
VRIAFDSRAATRALVILTRSGILTRLQVGQRRKILHAPGDGGTALVTVRSERGSAHVRDPHGQAHLTATGAVIALQRVLGLDGAPPPSGIAFPEQTPVPEHALATLRGAGVEVSLPAKTSD